MALKIKWYNRCHADYTEVYRDTAPFTEASLPAVLVTLPGTDTEYTDTTVAGSTKYYYAIRAKMTAGPAYGALSDLVSFTTAYSGSTPVVKGAYVYQSANTGYSAYTWHVEAWDTVDFDPDSAFNGTNGFTIPAAWDGRYVEFSQGNPDQGTGAIGHVVIQMYPAGGSSWVSIADTGEDRGEVTMRSPPILVHTGDQFRVYYYPGASGVTLTGGRQQYFSALVLPLI